MKDNNSTVQQVTGAWNAGNVCSEYGVCRRTVSKWQSNKVIPFYRVGGIIRFDPEKVKRALENYEIKAIEPVRSRSRKKEK